MNQLYEKLQSEHRNINVKQYDKLQKTFINKTFGYIFIMFLKSTR